MASSTDSVSMALFCDFENVALGVRDAKYDKFDIKRVLERLLLKGSIVVKKAYCDWERYKSFKAAMHEANFELIEIPHVRQSGKNSADIRLVVDALDLCYTKSHVDTFVIISGDSDFSPLVSKLRENAKQVIGVGVKQSTSDLLIANCDEFIFYDDLVRDSQRAAAKREARDNPPPASRRSPEEERQRREEIEALRGKAIDIAVETFEALLAERGESGKIWSSMLKEAIKRRKPDFNESYFGFRAFGNLLEEAQARGLLELGRDEKSGIYVTRPGPGMAVAEIDHGPRELRSVEAPARAADTHAEGVGARPEPAAQGGRHGGRGGRRHGGKTAETEAHAAPAASAPAAEVIEHVPAPQHVRAPTQTELEVVQHEPQGTERAEASAASAQGEVVQPSSRGRGRGRAAAAKTAAGSAVPAVEPAPPAPEQVQGQPSDAAPADEAKEQEARVGETGGAPPDTPKAAARGGRARKAREAKATVASTAAGERPDTETVRAANAVPDAAVGDKAVPDGAVADGAAGRNGEVAKMPKSAPRARRPRKPKTDASE